MKNLFKIDRQQMFEKIQNIYWILKRGIIE